VPLPRVGDEPLADTDLIAWVQQFLNAIYPLPEGSTSS